LAELSPTCHPLAPCCRLSQLDVTGQLGIVWRLTLAQPLLPVTCVGACTTRVSSWALDGLANGLARVIICCRRCRLLAVLKRLSPRQAGPAVHGTADDGTLSGKGRAWPVLDGMKPLAASCAEFAWRTAAGRDAGSLKLSWLRGCSSCRRNMENQIRSQSQERATQGEFLAPWKPPRQQWGASDCGINSKCSNWLCDSHCKASRRGGSSPGGKVGSGPVRGYSSSLKTLSHTIVSVRNLAEQKA